MSVNFKCPKTGKKFYYQQYRTIASPQGPIYKDKYGKELINPENGEKLIPIPKEGPIQAPMILGSTDQRIARNAKYFKERAKKHASSDEGKYEKQKNLNREIKNLKNK